MKKLVKLEKPLLCPLCGCDKAIHKFEKMNYVRRKRKYRCHECKGWLSVNPWLMILQISGVVTSFYFTNIISQILTKYTNLPAASDGDFMLLIYLILGLLHIHITGWFIFNYAPLEKHWNQ